MTSYNMNTTCWPYGLHMVVQGRVHSTQHGLSVKLYKVDQFVKEFSIKFSCISLIQESFLFPTLRNKFIILPDIIVQALLALQTLLDCSRPMTSSHMTSRSCVLSLSQTNNNTNVYICPNPNSSQSLSTHLSYNIILNACIRCYNGD